MVAMVRYSRNASAWTQLENRSPSSRRATAWAALSVQRQTNAGREFTLRDRLLKQIDAFVQAALMDDRVP
jgi:hypothetical protein